MEVTHDQVIELLDSDIDFAVSFAIENNFQGLRDQYESITGNIINNPQDLKDIIIKGLEDQDEQIYGTLNVPYIDDQGIWTDGFSDYFLGNMSMDNRSLSFAAVLSIIGAIATATSGSLSNRPGQTTETVEQRLAREKAEREAAEREAKRKMTTTIVVVVGIVLLIAGIATFIIMSQPKPTAKQAA